MHIHVLFISIIIIGLREQTKYHCSMLLGHGNSLSKRRISSPFDSLFVKYLIKISIIRFEPKYDFPMSIWQFVFITYKHTISIFEVQLRDIAKHNEAHSKNTQC